MQKSLVFILLMCILFSGGLFSRGEKFDKKELEQVLKTTPEIEQAEILNNLAEACSWTEETDRMKALAGKALELALKYSQTEQECYANINIGSSYFRKNLFKTALKYLDHALQLNIKVKTMAKHWYHGKISVIKGAILLKSGNTEKAILLLRDALAYAEKKMYRDLIADSCRYSAEYYVQNNDIKMALRYLKKGFKHAETDRDNNRYKEISKRLSVLYLETGNKKKSDQFLTLHFRGVGDK